FPKARVARYDPDATRGAKGERQRAEAAAAEIVIGTRGALRLFGPASLGVAGFVSPDHLLRLPDFRAGERLFSLLWAAAERRAAASSCSRRRPSTTSSRPARARTSRRSTGRR